MSLSARRAWIEILTRSMAVCVRRMVALRKESVDRNTESVSQYKNPSRRSPQGERG